MVVLRGLVVFMAHSETHDAMHPAVSFETPNAIGPYRVLRAVAQGGMATVYEVSAPHNHERRALKILRSSSETARLRFYREYEALCSLNHPNIARAYVFGEWNGHPWYTMEFLTGTTVQAHVKNIGVPGDPARTQAVLQVGRDLMSALAQIHKWGIVHRDLKAANVVVLPNGQAKLVDFGTAAVQNPTAHIPEEGEFLGTYTYASPEQYLGRPVDHRSDLYSAGVLLYRLATGKLPFTETEAETLANMHLHETPSAPKAFVTALPSKLSNLIMGLLEKTPERRPQSAEQVCRLLTGLIDNEQSAPVDLSKQSTRAIGQEVTLFAIQDFLQLAASPRKPGTPSTLVLFGVPGSGRRELLRAATLRTPNDPPMLRLNFTKAEPAIQTVNEALVHHATDGEPIDHQRTVDSTLNLAKAHSVAHGEPLTVTAHHPSDAGEEAVSYMLALIERAEAAPSQLRVLIAARPSKRATYAHPSIVSIDTVPLSIRGVRRLAANLVHRRPPPEPVAVWLHQRTGGLPGHVRQLVHTLNQQASQKQSGSWRWGDVFDGPGMQLSLTSTREAEDLRALESQPRLVVATLAMLGGALDLDSLQSTLRLSSKVLAPTLQHLKASLWLDWSRNQRGDAVVTLCAHRVPQLICSALGETTQAKLRQQLAQALPVRNTSEHGLKWLLCNAPTRVSAADATLWAMPLKRAHRPRDIVQGLEPFMNANRDLPMDEAGQGLLLIYLQALMVSRPADPQLGAWFRKLDSCANGAPPSYRLSVYLLHARLQQMIGHVTNTRKYLGQAWQVHQETPSPRAAARVATANAWHADQEGRADQAAKWHGKARRLARDAKCEITIAHAELGVATWQLSRGHLSEAERTCAALLSTTGTLNDPGLHGRTLSTWANSLRQQGRISEALRRLWKEMLPLERAQTPTGHIHSLLATAWCELELGRLGCTQEHLDDIAASVGKDTHLILRVEAGLLQGRLLTASGNAEDAARVMKEVQTRAERGSLFVYGAVAKALRAEALWMNGAAHVAKPLFDEALKTLLPIGDMPRLAQVCRAHARVAAEEVTTDLLFAPIRSWIDNHPALLAQLSESVAFGQYHSKRGLLTDGSDWVETAATLHDFEDRLASEEQAALRVHPWSRISRAFG